MTKTVIILGHNVLRQKLILKRFNNLSKLECCVINSLRVSIEHYSDFYIYIFP